MTSPHVAIAGQAYARMRAILIEFGMTPASRTRIAVQVPIDKNDPAARFLTW